MTTITNPNARTIVKPYGHDRRTVITFNIETFQNGQWKPMTGANSSFVNLRAARDTMMLIQNQYPGLKRRLIEVETKSTIHMTVIAEDE